MPTEAKVTIEQVLDTFERWVEDNPTVTRLIYDRENESLVIRRRIKPGPRYKSCSLEHYDMPPQD